MTTIAHPTSTVRCGPIVHRDETQPNYRRGGDIRTLLSPASVGATAAFMGTLTPRARRDRHRTLASVLRGVPLLRLG